MSSFLLARWTYTGFKIKGNLFLRQLTKILKVPFLQFSWVYLLFCDIENCEIPKVRYWNYLYSETPAAKESFHISEANSTENWLKHNKQAAVGRAVTPRGVSQPSFYPTSDAEFKAKTSSPIYHLNKTIKKKKKNRSEVTHRADELNAAMRWTSCYMAGAEEAESWYAHSVKRLKSRNVQTALDKRNAMVRLLIILSFLLIVCFKS